MDQFIRDVVQAVYVIMATGFGLTLIGAVGDALHRVWIDRYGR